MNKILEIIGGIIFLIGMIAMIWAFAHIGCKQKYGKDPACYAPFYQVNQYNELK